MKSKINGSLPHELAIKVRNRRLKEVGIRSLKTHPLQPPTRLNKVTAKYEQLLSSAKLVGILNPVHVSGNTMHTFDGHRRRMIAEDVGRTTIWAYVYDNLTEKEEQMLFKFLNTTNLRFSRKQEMHVYLEGGEASTQTKTACSNIFTVGEHVMGNGQKFLHEVARSQLCGITLNEAMTGFVSYIRKDKRFQCKISDVQLKAMLYKYCINVASPYKIKQLLWEKTVTPEQLFNHVKALKPVKTKTVLIDG